jgi:DNA-binding response OmpR family regulator
VLEINSFSVDTAASAREARHKLRTQEYAMIITDMRMENETAGVEVVKAARSAAYDPAIAVLTAFPEEGADYSTDGADEVLVKPMNVQQLVVQMEALLVSHEDKKQKRASVAAKPAPAPQPAKPAAKKASPKKSTPKKPAPKPAKKAAAAKKPASNKKKKPVAKKAAKKAAKKSASKSPAKRKR